jgi:hypothetical protein
MNGTAPAGRKLLCRAVCEWTGIALEAAVKNCSLEFRKCLLKKLEMNITNEA